MTKEDLDSKRFIWGVGDVVFSGKKKVQEGGPGSGNFDHAGRPGEVGGSGEGPGVGSGHFEAGEYQISYLGKNGQIVKTDNVHVNTRAHVNSIAYSNLSRISGATKVKITQLTSPGQPGPGATSKLAGKYFFHGTSDTVVQSIEKNGLTPQGGKGADIGVVGIDWGKPTAMSDESKGHIYITRSFDSARSFAGIAAKANPGSKPVVLEIRVSKEYASQLEKDPATSSGWRLKGKIPPSAMAIVRIHEKKFVDGVTIFLGFAVTDIKIEGAHDDSYQSLDGTDVADVGGADGLTEGGSGSGNFGHAGRPGEVGGSGDAGGGVELSFEKEGEGKDFSYKVVHAGKSVAFIFQGHPQPDKVSWIWVGRAGSLLSGVPPSRQFSTLDSVKTDIAYYLNRRLAGKKEEGGPGSGNFGHSGRAGEVGGSGEGNTGPFRGADAARAADARRPILSPDVWSREARDMVRMALFAGFDAQSLITRCLVGSKGTKISIRTVQKVLTAMEYEAKKGGGKKDSLRQKVEKIKKALNDSKK